MADEKTDKRPRTRSPAYPSWGLVESIAKAKIVYDKEGQGRHAVPITAIAKDWDYASVNGSALTSVSALKQFGLFEEVADSNPRQLRLTPRALNIIARSEASPERMAAIREAATAPKLYADLWKKYGWPLPSDSTIREYLHIDLGYGAKFVDGIIKDFKQAILFAKLHEGDRISVANDGIFKEVERFLNDKSEADQTEQEMTTQPSAADPLRTPAQPSQFPLATGTKEDRFAANTGSIVVQWPAKMSKADYEDACLWFDIVKRKMGRDVQDGPTN